MLALIFDLKKSFLWVFVDCDLPRLEVRSDAAGSLLIVGGRATGAGWFVWSFETVEDNEGVKDEDELTLLKDSLERIEADG